MSYSDYLCDSILEFHELCDVLSYLSRRLVSITLGCLQAHTGSEIVLHSGSLEFEIQDNPDLIEFLYIYSDRWLAQALEHISSMRYKNSRLDEIKRQCLERFEGPREAARYLNRLVGFVTHKLIVSNDIHMRMRDFEVVWEDACDKVEDFVEKVWDLIV